MSLIIMASHQQVFDDAYFQQEFHLTGMKYQWFFLFGQYKETMTKKSRAIKINSS